MVYPVPYEVDEHRHDDFKDSAYIYVGGIPYELTEGDIICVFSQYGEILDINLVRDRETGKSKGFCFLKYDDQRSTVLAVDNFNGATLLGRTLRVDHSRDYRQLKKKKRKGHEDSESESSEEELDEDGKPRVKGFNVAPKGWLEPLVEEDESEVDSLEEGIDPDDPMKEYLIERRREERAAMGKEKKHRRKRIKEEGEERERNHRHRHRYLSENDNEERHRHRRHRHDKDRPRIKGGSSGID
jgi:RNA-binding motif protein, X-linked 2